MKATIKQIQNCMYEYQKTNNITSQCIANCMYLYDAINKTDMSVKAIAVIAFIEYNEYLTGICSGHVVLETPNGSIVDPSHEIISYKSVTYFRNIKELKESLEITSEQCKQIIIDVLKMTSTAKKINEGKARLIDKTHYNNQANYIENKLK